LLKGSKYLIDLNSEDLKDLFKKNIPQEL